MIKQTSVIDKSVHIHKSDKGFTLVESLVAISILSLSVLASFTAVQSGLQGSNYAKDQITAFWLTQEAMEYIKNVRDENALASLGGVPVSWLTGLSAQASDPCFFDEVCTIYSYESTVSLAVSGAPPCTTSFDSCDVLRQDTVNGSPTLGLYGYNSNWTPTNFKREIKFVSITPNEEVKVIIQITWTTRGVKHLFQTSQLLFNRQ